MLALKLEELGLLIRLNIKAVNFVIDVEDQRRRWKNLPKLIGSNLRSLIAAVVDHLGKLRASVIECLSLSD